MTERRAGPPPSKRAPPFGGDLWPVVNPWATGYDLFRGRRVAGDPDRRHRCGLREVRHRVRQAGAPT